MSPELVRNPDMIVDHIMFITKVMFDDFEKVLGEERIKHLIGLATTIPNTDEGNLAIFEYDVAAVIKKQADCHKVDDGSSLLKMANKAYINAKSASIRFSNMNDPYQKEKLWHIFMRYARAFSRLIEAIFLSVNFDDVETYLKRFEKESLKAKRVRLILDYVSSNGSITIPAAIVSYPNMDNVLMGTTKRAFALEEKKFLKRLLLFNDISSRYTTSVTGDYDAVNSR
jgi:hypothetical protein